MFCFPLNIFFNAIADTQNVSGKQMGIFNIHLYVSLKSLCLISERGTKNCFCLRDSNLDLNTPGQCRGYYLITIFIET